MENDRWPIWWGKISGGDLWKIRKNFWKSTWDFDVNHRKARCVDCEGEDTNKPVIGLVIKGLIKGNEYNSENFRS
jgi:hypothetical protein